LTLNQRVWSSSLQRPTRKRLENIKLFYRRPYFRSNDIRDQVSLAPICSESAISYKGQYLTGATVRFDGIYQAYCFVRSRFWRSVFTHLSGLSRSDDSHERLVATLRKRLGRNRIEVTSEETLRALGYSSTSRSASGPVPEAIRHV
jgi:hypothetical protein